MPFGLTFIDSARVGFGIRGSPVWRSAVRRNRAAVASASGAAKRDRRSTGSVVHRADLWAFPEATPQRCKHDWDMRFLNRREAGQRLAGELMDLAEEEPVVVALPRGGVPVAAEVARALGAPLEILAVRKLGAPGNPELGVGAVAEDGTCVLDRQSAGMLGMTPAMFDETLARESRELRRRVERYRDGRAPISVKGRTAIIVDDGLATGLTDLAAVRALRKRGACRSEEHTSELQSLRQLVCR